MCCREFRHAGRYLSDVIYRGGEKQRVSDFWHVADLC